MIEKLISEIIPITDECVEKKDDVLRDVSDCDLSKLRDVYKIDWPKNIQAFNFIDNFINWKRINPNVRALFTSPNGDWKKGTFVAIIEENVYNIFFFTLEKSSETLCKALKETSRIEWNRGPYICAIHDDHDDAIMETLRNIGQPIEFDIPSSCWWLPKEEALNFDLSLPNEDVYIDKLNTSHVNIINSLWPHSFEGSDRYLANLIEMNGGFGIFSKSNDSICSWIMKNDFGTLGILETVSGQKRNGYARLVTKILSKKLAEDGLDVTAFIVRKNIVSQSLFRSLGFKLLYLVRWVQFKKT